MRVGGMESKTSRHAEWGLLPRKGWAPQRAQQADGIRWAESGGHQKRSLPMKVKTEAQRGAWAPQGGTASHRRQVGTGTWPSECSPSPGTTLRPGCCRARVGAWPGLFLHVLRGLPRAGWAPVPPARLRRQGRRNSCLEPPGRLVVRTAVSMAERTEPGGENCGNTQSPASGPSTPSVPVPAALARVAERPGLDGPCSGHYPGDLLRLSEPQFFHLSSGGGDTDRIGCYKDLMQEREPRRVRRWTGSHSALYSRHPDRCLTHAGPQ